MLSLRNERGEKQQQLETEDDRDGDAEAHVF